MVHHPSFASLPPTVHHVRQLLPKLVGLRRYFCPAAGGIGDLERDLRRPAGHCHGKRRRKRIAYKRAAANSDLGDGVTKRETWPVSETSDKFEADQHEGAQGQAAVPQATDTNNEDDYEEREASQGVPEPESSSGRGG